MGAVVTGRIFNVQHFSTEDGPGIRTTVFLKGCPLRCQWCANPESQEFCRQLAHRASKCIGCGACLQACNAGALSSSARGIQIDRTRCVSCGACAQACPSGAMFFYGQDRTVEDVFEEVRRDLGYYRQSGGGVTVSGGECMAQPEFVAALFRLCRAERIHTALDTCGYFDPKLLPMVWDVTDLALYDIKLGDDAGHQRLTGVGNAVILENLRALRRKGVPIRIRVPLIPGVNDREEDLIAIADLIKKHAPDAPVDLLPYHRFGENKYEMLGRSYLLSHVRAPEDRQKAAYAEAFQRHGLNVVMH